MFETIWENMLIIFDGYSTNYIEKYITDYAVKSTS